jgi:uncharacterized membrane protein YjgN (DUF898 family)
MKNYFNFNLTGKKLLPIWLLFLVFFMAPYVTMITQMKNLQAGNSPSMLLLPVLLLLIIVSFLFIFYIAKYSIESVVFKGIAFEFKGTLGTFIGKVLLGLLLSIVTFGIYLAWFVKDIQSFFVDNSSYNSQSFSFRGQGGNLFVIFLLSLILPMFLFVIVMTIFLMNNMQNIAFFMIIQQVVIIVIMIPYMYYVYKWMVNVNYKDYNIRWETNFWESCGKIALEILLSIITLGIYMPLAMLRLFKFFAGKTKAVALDRKLNFGFEIDQLNDFLFIWGQLLLTIITLGIYYPWAFCKIGKRILSKTYLEVE